MALATNSVDFIVWDWKDTPPADELSRCAKLGLTHFQYADDGSDSYVLVATATEVSPDQAIDLWVAYTEDEA